MQYEVVIFDLDGTLLDTIEDLADAVNTSLKMHGMPLRTLDEIRQFVGNGITVLMERAVPGGKDNSEFDSAFREFKNYYAGHCNDKTKPYPGIAEMLKKIKKENVRMAIVSNKADFAVKELNSFYFNDIMDVALGENEVAGIRRKPAPDMVFEVLKHFNCPAAKALYVGDSEVDLATARAADIACVGVAWGFRGRDFLEQNGADVIIDTPAEMLDILKI